ncbi:MAG: 3'-5' exonuclease, partial [Solirubrobacterales bacterium]
GLFNFINFINKLKNSSGDMGSAKILGENENVVRIMSIHKSKGLEFPVVFLCGTGKKFNMMDANQSILFHQELGYGPDYVDYDRRISYPTLIKQIVKKKIKTETLSEEMRILYVAFTRAKEKLIITGVVKDIRKNSEKWCSGVDISREKLSSYYLLNSKCFLDWLGAAVVRNNGGEIIRELGGFQEFSGDDNGKWNLRIWNKYDVIQEKISEGENDTEVYDLKFEIKDPAIYEEVKKKLEWEYDFSSLGNIPAKISVSELKSEGIKYPVILKKPGFLEKSKRITGAEKGTIMHLVMQHLDLKKVDLESIALQVEQMVQNEFLTSEEAKEVSINKISSFFKTPLGVRMTSSGYIKRETPFFIKLNVKDVYPEIKLEKEIDETILLQGVIDCYFEENGEIILVDYKTDYVDDSLNIAEKYKKQVDLYANALEKITGKTVKEKYLYLFSSSEIVKMN